MGDLFDKRVGQALKLARENAGYTQPQLADKLGWKAKTYQNYEIGKSSLNLSQAREIADVLNTSIDLIFKDLIQSENSVDEIPEAIKEKIQQIDTRFYPILIDIFDAFINHSSYPKNSN